MNKQLLEKIDNLLNPIVVKELRQALNSKSFLGILSIMLIGEMGFLFIYLFNVEPEATTLGKNLFQGFLFILNLICGFIIPIFAATRFEREHTKDKQSLELIHITTISPYKIISGKFFSALILICMFYSLSMPFMTISYFLRGIDIPRIVFMIFISFVMNLPILQLAICVGGLQCSRILKIIFAINFIWFLIGMIISVIAEFSVGFIAFGFGSTEFWTGICLFVLITLLVTGFFYVFAGTMISPSSSNRLFPFRVYVSSVWLITLIIALIFDHFFSSTVSIGGGRNTAVKIWYIFFSMLFMIMLGAAFSERDKWGLRILKTVPKHPFKRFLYFFHSTGRANGFLYALILQILSLCVILAELYFKRSYSGIDDLVSMVLTVSGIQLYILCFSLFSLSLYNLFFERIFPNFNPTKIALILLTASVIVPFIFMFFVYAGKTGEINFKNMIGFFMFSPIYMAYEEGRPVTVTLLSCLSVILVLFHWSWLKERYNNFTPVLEPVYVKEENNEVPAKTDLN